MEEKYIIAYDHGTSGMKTAIISTTGKVMGFTLEEYGLIYPEQGGVEQNPLDWWKALKNTTHELLSKNLVPIEDIVACVTSNQMSGTIPIDSEGNLLHNCLTWLDTRGAPIIQKLVKGVLNISGYGISNIFKWIGKTGGAPGLSGKDIIGHILWFKQKHPEIYEKTWKFLDCKDYLTYKLTGKVVTSYDCGILTWVMNDKDPNNIFYDPELLKKTKMDVDKLPEIHPATYVVGDILPEIAKELGVTPNTKIVLGAGDMGSAAIGSGATQELQTHICIGSSSWVICHYPKRKVDIFHMVACLPSAIPGKYIALGEQESAGINLTWLRDKLLYHKDELLMEEHVPDVYKIFDKVVESIKPGDSKVIFSPWMFGERAPVEDHTIRGAIHNLSLDIDRRHIIRAIFEGVAFNSNWLLKYLEKLVESKLDPITIIGGGAMSDIWCQTYADILDRKIKQVKYPKEANSIGAALIASVALGYINWDQIHDLVEINKEFEPREEYREFYDNLFKEFVNTYENNKKMYKKLNKLEH